MKDYVQIQSSMTITVTCGLHCKNFTKIDSDMPDRLKVKPTWPRMTCLIKAGNHFYPSEITEWNSVKACVRNKIMTIGVEADNPGDDTDAIAAKQKLKVAMADPGEEPVDDSPTEEDPIRKPRKKKAEAPKEEPKPEPAKEESLDELTEDEEVEEEAE